MRFLHTMVRTSKPEEALEFYCGKLKFIETKRIENNEGRYTLIYLAAPEDAEQAKETETPLLELTYNWPDEDGNVETFTGSRQLGHIAFEVDNLYDTCQDMIDKGITINRPPRDGYLAFIKSPDGISIEFIQKGTPLAPQEPWLSMKNIGSW